MSLDTRCDTKQIAGVFIYLLFNFYAKMMTFYYKMTLVISTEWGNFTQVITFIGQYFQEYLINVSIVTDI